MNALNKTITIDDLMKHDPCYTRGEIIKMYGKKPRTLLQILNMRKLVIDDKIWVITRFLPNKENRKFAIWCARQCKTKVKEATNYINIIERYYIFKTATEEELHAADRAAYSASDRVFYWIAYCTSYSASARAAYNAADRAACWAANTAAMRKKQIKKLKEIIGGEK